MGFGDARGCGVVSVAFWGICRTREGAEGLAQKQILSFWKGKVSSKQQEVSGAELRSQWVILNHTSTLLVTCLLF